MSTERTQVSLRKYNSWRVGGVAELLFQPSQMDDWQAWLKKRPSQSDIRVLGLGSNVLVRDDGVDGAVVVLQGSLNEMKALNSIYVEAQAGVACGTLARFCAKQGLGGLEFFAGIPGTVGGALRMNAGCWGGETWQFVREVSLLDRSGNLKTCTPSDFSIAYRQVDLPEDSWFASAIFELIPDEPDVIKAKIRELVNQRQATQPSSPSCGSVFKNPPGGYAAQLIESCGLKGYQIGQAQVSSKHANFIINQGQAQASDIEHLIQHVQDTVYQQAQVKLEHEVHMLGQSG